MRTSLKTNIAVIYRLDVIHNNPYEWAALYTIENRYNKIELIKSQSNSVIENSRFRSIF